LTAKTDASIVELVVIKTYIKKQKTHEVMGALLCVCIERKDIYDMQRSILLNTLLLGSAAVTAVFAAMITLTESVHAAEPGLADATTISESVEVSSGLLMMSPVTSMVVALATLTIVVSFKFAHSR
jgi:hypothetical protein